MKKLMVIIGIMLIININVLEGKMTEEILETQITSKIGQKKYQGAFDSKIFNSKTYVVKSDIESSRDVINRSYYINQTSNEVKKFKNVKDSILKNNNQNFDISMEEFQSTRKEIEILKSDDNKIKDYIKNKIK